MTRGNDERGSATLEAVIIVPMIGMFLAITIAGGRVAMAQQAVQAAASDAARSASIARTASTAASQGRAAGNAGVTNQGLACSPATVTIDTSQFSRPVGTPASVTATIRCNVRTADLGLPAVGSIVVEASQTSPLDTFRGR